MREWKLRAEEFLSRLYTLCKSIASISQSYLSGNEVLFPQQAEELGTLVREAERVVTVFHETLVSDLEQHLRLWEKVGPEDTVTPPPDSSISIDCEALEQGAWEQTAAEVLCLVDMAKAEALDYLGDTRAAVEVVERHLG